MANLQVSARKLAFTHRFLCTISGTPLHTQPSHVLLQGIRLVNTQLLLFVCLLACLCACYRLPNLGWFSHSVPLTSLAFLTMHCKRGLGLGQVPTYLNHRILPNHIQPYNSGLSISTLPAWNRERILYTSPVPSVHLTSSPKPFLTSSPSPPLHLLFFTILLYPY